MPTFVYSDSEAAQAAFVANGPQARVHPPATDAYRHFIDDPPTQRAIPPRLAGFAVAVIDSR